MSLYNHKISIALLAFGIKLFILGGCGFTPVYGPGGASHTLTGNISFQDPGDKNNFYLVQRLEERLGAPSQPAFNLTYSTILNTQKIEASDGSTANRYHLVGQTTWSLNRQNDGARIAGGTAYSFTAYTTADFTIAEIAAEDDANFRLMRILADQIVSEILAQSDKLE